MARSNETPGFDTDLHYLSARTGAVPRAAKAGGLICPDLRRDHGNFRLDAHPAAALAVLRDSISVDVHSHGGKTGIISKAPPSNDLADAMRVGSLAVACLANVPDWPVLGRTAQDALTAVRAPESGELYRYHLGRLAWIDQLVTDHGVRRALCAADLEAAHKTGQPAIIADGRGSTFSR